MFDTDFMGNIGDFIKNAQEAYRDMPKPSNNGWKYCVALTTKEWKMHRCYKPRDNSDDLIFNWRKEGEEEITVRLSFTEQCLWIEYVEQKEKQNAEKTKNG